MQFPIQPQKAIPEIYVSDASSQEEDVPNPMVRTIEKTNQLGKQISGTGRKIVPLSKEESISEAIEYLKSNWSAFTYTEIEGELERLDGRLSLEEGPSSKVKELANLHFRVAFPLLEEFEANPFSFAGQISEIGQAVLQQHSLKPFQESLNERQQREILRFAIPQQEG
jgi:hypothetical protein